MYIYMCFRISGCWQERGSWDFVGVFPNCFEGAPPSKEGMLFFTTPVTAAHMFALSLSRGTRDLNTMPDFFRTRPHPCR